MVKVISLLQDALLVRSSPVLQLIQLSTRKVTSLSPNTRPVLPTALVSQHRPLSTPSTGHVTGHVRDHPLYAAQGTCYHSDVKTKRGLALKRSHQLRRRPLSRLPGKRGDQSKVRTPSLDHKVWILRLAHENSYLSWSRNAAICAGIAAIVRIFDTRGVDPLPSVGSESLITVTFSVVH